MNFHEYQAKELFERYGVAVPAGRVVDNLDQVGTAAEEIGGDSWVVKAQVHAGGRGKAGGVKLVNGMDELKDAVESMLGMEIETYQTGGRALPVKQVLIAEATDIAEELYLSVLVDRGNECITFMASREGGVDIEKVAEETPDRILTVQIDEIERLQPYHCRQIAYGLGLSGKQVKQLGQIMTGLYRLFTEKDLNLVEVNPLVITKKGDLLALDAKVNADDNALFRHEDLAEMQDESQEDETELAASKHGLNYVTLDGNIACMVNGAGLAMATMDVIKLHGGEPANFLDVGGTATAERVTEAFKLILAGENVKAILVNIFGGIVRCDLIAEGIIKAVEEVHVDVPVVVRLEGTNVDEGREMLESSGMKITTAKNLTDAAKKAVAAAK